MMYHQVENNLQNQEFLDTYCVGFDAEHMPEGADPKENFKDYLLGTYDGEPKTPEWAEAICGVPAATTRRLAEEIAKTEKVDFFAGQSTTRFPLARCSAQAFYTLAFMHGVGTPGNYVGWLGMHEHGYSTTPYCFAGDASNGAGKNPVNRWLPRSSCLCPIGLKLPTKTPGKRWTTPSAGSPFSTGPTDATPGPAARSPLTSTSSTRAATRTV